VLPVEESEEAMFEKILVAIDGSPASEKALVAAVELARHYRTELTALGVAELPAAAGVVGEIEGLREGTEAHFRDLGAAAVEYARSKGVALRSVVVRGHPADAIVRYAESERMTLIVLGQHGHSRIARFFLGSNTDRVSEHAPCSVMIVK
jgi:nucleotide-binding universal stress UspA family protein